MQCDTDYHSLSLFMTENEKFYKKWLKFWKRSRVNFYYFSFSFHRRRAFNPEITMQCLHSAATRRKQRHSFFFNLSIVIWGKKFATCDVASSHKNIANFDFGWSTFDFYRLIIELNIFRVVLICKTSTKPFVYSSNVEQMLITMGVECNEWLWHKASLKFV